MRFSQIIAEASSDALLDRPAQLAAASAMVADPAFQAWFRGSAVVTRHGKPLLMMHGTEQDFERFDPNFFMTNNDGEADEAGFYFTTRAKMAARYATRNGRVVAAFLRVLNPYRCTALEWAYCESLSPAEARAKGHDGYLIAGQEGGQTWIVWSADAIREIMPTRTRAARF